MNYLGFIYIVSFFAVAFGSNWATYPQVPKTASINGFADPIYTKLPDCAQECVEFDTDNTPCPYWDTGCFCVMPQWAGEVAECLVSKCSGDDISSATSLATSLCSSVGANQWLIPASLSTALSSAVTENKDKETTNVKSTSATSTNDSSITSSSVSNSENKTSSSSTSVASSSTSSSSNEAGALTTKQQIPAAALIMFLILSL